LIKSSQIEIKEDMQSLSPKEVFKDIKKALFLEGSPKQKAKSVAFGVFIAFTPTYGLHTITAFFFSWIFRLRFSLVLLSSWVNNPWTLVPIYVSSYVVGKMLLLPFHISYSKSFVSQIRTLSSWQVWGLNTPKMFITIGLPFLVGSLFLGIFLGIISYIVVLKMLQRRSVNA